MIGTPADEWRRIADLLGDGKGDGLLLRAPSIRRDTLPLRGGYALGAGVRVAPVLPAVRTAWNSDLPSGGNDGALWAGRGTSALVRGGLVAERGRVRLVLLPELAIAGNRGFAFTPSTRAGVSGFASPWFNTDGFSADVPSRFGNRPYGVVSMGQSSLTAHLDANLAVGVSTENHWWGPGVRNAVVLSNNAEGFPHIFVRTARPARTRFGTFEARWLLGTLTSSLYFDTLATRQWRSYNALAVSLRPARIPHLTIGVQRAVTTDLEGRRWGMFGHAIDAIGLWENNTIGTRASDGLTGGFFRYVVQPAHVEVYGEWARQYMPGSLRELFAAPQDGQGYTVGVQHVRPFARATRSLRVQAEATNLEQSILFRERPVPVPFYTGIATPGGYTHRGQVLGATIGPSGQSQWLAVDLLDGVDGARQGGVYVGRIRWNNDSMYPQPGSNFFRHDFSIYAGARGVWRAPFGDLAGDVTWGKRYNYEFQNGSSSPGLRRTVDVRNVSAGLTLTPR